MNLLDLTLPSPAENLACDEALLDVAEAGSGDEVLRFWESPEYFVVVGYANKVATEANMAACEARGIPVLRRCSGGGTVLQGPGCLNYALVLQITEHGPLCSISAANRFIMERNRAAIDSSLPTPHSALQIQGHTDLVVGGRKFSGNSQRRRKHFLLFHGTLLLDFDLALVSEFLRTPSKQPAYRECRGHTEFLTNLKTSVGEAKAALSRAWVAAAELKAWPMKETLTLVAGKYSTGAWNLKF